MKKKILSFLTLLCMVTALLLMSPVHAATSGTCGDNLTWTLDDSGTLTISGTGTMNNFTYTYDYSYNEAYTTIPWYSLREHIKTISIGNGVITIGNYAFYGCKKVTSVTIPDTVTSIGDAAFYNCGSLTTLVIPNGVKSIGRITFYGCANLINITIPKSITSVDEEAFRGCSSLNNIYISDLEAYLNIDFYIWSCDYDNDGYDEYYDLSAIPTTFARNLYLNNELLTDVTIPDGIEKIPHGLFYNNENITRLIIPDSVTSIGEKAFLGCKNLKELSIGSGIKEIKKNVFSNNITLDKLYVKDIKTYLNFGNGIRANKFYVNGKRIQNLIIPEGVTQIPDYAFYGNKDLTSVTISNGVKNIGAYAFYQCENLAKLEMSDTIETMGDHAFTYCYKLSDVKLSKNLKVIPNYAFVQCNLESICIPEGITTIGDYALAQNKLAQFSIPTTVKEIGRYSFYKNYFTDITIPKTLTTIGDNAFYNCINLKKVKFEDSVKKIGKSLFAQCSILSDITFPETLEVIDENAFEYCYALTELTIPRKVSEIEQSAFNYCRNLNTVYYNGTEEEWNEIFIGANNDYLKNATKNYFWYVTLIDEDGEVINKKKYDLNSLVDVSDIEPKFEHTIHLYTDKACKNEFDFEKTAITENLTLYLKYILNQYNAKFVDDNGTVLQEGLVDYGAVITPPQDPTKERTQKYTYSFIGWDKFYKGITQTNKEMVFTAKYNATINKYTYNFLDNDNTVLKEETVDYGTIVTPPEAPADKDPYTFDYWDGYTNGAELTDDIEFKAVYKYKTYKITAEGLENTVDVVYNAPYELATQTPSEEEYLFNGYYTEKDGKGTKVTDKNGKSLKNYNFLNNITVYPYFFHELLNKIKINGEGSTVAGNTNVVKKVYFATDKNAQYLLCNLKYPESIELKKIVPIDFKYVSEESRTVSDGMVYLNLICQYTNNLDNLPINKKIEPFELVFDIPKNIAPQSISIEVTTDSMVIGDEEYSFDYIINGELEITSKPVESIDIIGESTVILEKGNANYTTEITPNQDSNKEVEWSVDNEDVAVISQDGTLTPKTTGTVVITATAKDGSGISSTKTVNIIAYAKINTLKTNLGQWETAFDPNVREYTVYVPKNTTKISFTASFTSGTLKLVNGNTTLTMMKNNARTINISNNETNIVLLKGNVDGCADSEYKIKIVKFEGTKTTISENGKTFIVKPINIEAGNTVILALYNGDSFVGMEAPQIYNGENLTFSTNKTYTNAKIMVWNSLTEMNPTCGIEEIVLNEN